MTLRTGSAQNNIRLATLAKKRGWQLKANGDGLFDGNGRRIAGDTEEGIFGNSLPEARRERLMALPGPEDGHLRMPNYLVERLSKLRLNGTQWQILWAVWRRTLCWQKSGQWGNRPTAIGISDLVSATEINQDQVKREMRHLVGMNIILRDNTPGGRGHKPLTAFNLDPSSWKLPLNSGASATLNERVAKETPFGIQKGSKDATLKFGENEGKGSGLAPQTVAESLPFTDGCATLSQPLSGVGKKLLKKDKQTSTTKVVDGDKAPDTLAAQTPASKYLFEQTGRKRWQNLVQKKEFEKAECEVGEERMKEAIDWALTSGISNIKSMITAARRKNGRKVRAGTGGAPPREPRAGGRRTKAPTHEQYLRGLPPGQPPGVH